MSELFKQTVRTAVTMELVELAVQAADGTKVPANASLYRSYDADQLCELLYWVEKAIADLEAQNEGGEDCVTTRLPGEVGRPEDVAAAGKAGDGGTAGAGAVPPAPSVPFASI